MSVTESQSSCSRISNRLSYSFADDSVDDLLNYGFLEDDEDLPTILSNIVFSDIPSSFCFSEIHVSDGDQASTHYHCPLVDQRYHPLENVDRDMTLGFNEGFFIHSKPDEMISIDEGLLDIDKIRQSISRLSLETEYYDALDSQFNSSGGSLSSCPTAKLKCMLREHKIPHGPLVKSTKRVYLYQLQKASNGLKGSSHVINHAYETTTKSTPLEYNDVVISTFNGKLMECVSKWVSLELTMIEMIEVLDQPQLKLDLFKQYFTYLLLDPTISKNIEGSVCPETVCQSWPYFLKAVFYIGKGKNSRPLDHLTDAVKGDKLSDKIRKIRTIWEKGLGVVCIKIFHNINEPEALTREATMINALSISHLTNQQNGKCYGGIERWSLKKRRQLGVVLLYRSMLTLIAEGQRQIFATDIRR
ncbi:hypothetical protein GE061_000926 [Apolygus lucorum]|uniref:LEM domain-containing protein n=1 Tax=Apolygus lucorum TaxID=248454 RepID=A0A8S9Y5X7_APOLU|nr:hypothetical protein GE061_000926 [Apolygus lucorum]